MEGILKHMKRPTGKIKSSIIVTKKAIRLLIVPTRRRKRKMITIRTSPVRKVKPVLKIYPIILTRKRRPYTPYKLRPHILKRNNMTYHTHMEIHTEIHFSIEGKIPGAGT